MIFCSIVITDTNNLSFVNEKRSIQSHSVTVMTPRSIEHFNRMFQDDEPMTVFKDKYVLTYVGFYLKKNSPLTGAINQHMLALRSSGCFDYLNRKYKTSSQKRETQSQLTMDHLIATFYICATSYCIAYFVCILEIIVWNARQ